MAYDEGLATRIREHFGETRALTEKKMFGGLCFLYHGHMIAGILGDKLMARVGPDHNAAALARPHAREMDFTRRPMKGFVNVDPQGYEDDEDLAAWLNMAATFVQSLPSRTSD